MSVRSSITFTCIHSERLFGHIGSNTRFLTASQASEAIKTQCMMADSLGASSTQWTAGGPEASQKSSDFAAHPTLHDMHDTHNVSFTNKIGNSESIRFSSRFKASTTVGFQTTELRSTEFITNRIMVIDDGLGVLSDLAMNRIRAPEDMQLEMIDANLSESVENT